MSKPVQIQNQLAVVDELYKEMYSEDEPQAPTNQSPEPPVQPTPPAEPQEDWKQKYLTLQGMYNKDVPALRDQVAQQQEVISTLGNTPPAPVQPAPVQAPAPAKYITDEDVKEWGDSIEMMRKVSREEISGVLRDIADVKKMVSQIQTTVVPRVEQVAQRQEVSADQQFWSDLNRVVPDWQQINSNADFHTWLLEVDSLTGNRRQAYLEQAQANLDVNRVAAFFQQWKAMIAPSEPTPPVEDVRKKELETQIAPGRGRTVEIRDPANKAVVTRQFIANFYSDIRAGKYRGRDDERKRIEADIFTASQEGRIQ